MDSVVTGRFTAPGDTADLAGARIDAPVLVIDDQELISTALATALRSAGLDAHPVVGDGVDDFLSRATDLPPGLVTLDVDLGRVTADGPVDGVHLVRSLRMHGWKVLAVGGDKDEAGVAAAVAAGAVGAVHKSQPFHVLLRTVVDAAGGAAVMTDVEHQRWLRCHRLHQADARETTSRLGRLSPREREVLGLLTDGLRAAVIAERLVVSMPTVRTQIRAILAKLQVGSQLEAVALFRQQAGPTDRPSFIDADRMSSAGGWR